MSIIPEGRYLPHRRENHSPGGGKYSNVPKFIFERRMFRPGLQAIEVPPGRADISVHSSGAAVQADEIPFEELPRCWIVDDNLESLANPQANPRPT